MFKKRVALFCTLVLLAMPAISHGVAGDDDSTYKSAKKLYESSHSSMSTEYVKATELCLPLADKDNVACQYLLGQIYESQSVFASEKKNVNDSIKYCINAKKYFQMAADNGHAISARHAGILYGELSLGKCGNKDFTKAREYLEKAKALGDRLADGYLGQIDYTENPHKRSMHFTIIFVCKDSYGSGMDDNLARLLMQDFNSDNSNLYRARMQTSTVSKYCSPDNTPLSNLDLLTQKGQKIDSDGKSWLVRTAPGITLGVIGR
jgi:TPR repeat protein